MAKKIPLTQGKFAIVDDEDYEWLNQYKWCALKNGNTWYAVRAIRTRGKKSLEHMHRIIIGAPEDIQTDHANHNGLDNRKANLRLATNAQNQFNSRPQVGTLSLYKGVTKKGRSWSAGITRGGEHYRLGSYGSEEDAARAYDHAAVRMFGKFACLNFPEDSMVLNVDYDPGWLPPPSKKTSEYRGVSWCRWKKKWVAFICYNYKRYNLGAFDDEVLAATAYDAKAMELLGEKAKLNGVG